LTLLFSSPMTAPTGEKVVVEAWGQFAEKVDDFFRYVIKGIVSSITIPFFLSFDFITFEQQQHNLSEEEPCSSSEARTRAPTIVEGSLTNYQRNHFGFTRKLVLGTADGSPKKDLQLLLESMPTW
jgi:hypothetical protein